MIKANAKIFKIIYRLTLPGSLLIVISALLVRVGVLSDPQSPLVRFFPLAVFGTGLALSAFFRRSRLFFALLVLFLAELTFAFVLPHLAPRTSLITVNAVALLLPLTCWSWHFSKSAALFRRPGANACMVAAQIVAIWVLCLPALAKAASQIGRVFAPLALSRWSGLSQSALLAFLLSAVVITFPLVRRYKAVESSLLWSLVAAFVALRTAAVTHLDGVFFAAGGLALIVALIETSYAMAYLDELTQLPSRRSLNEALLKLGDSYSIAMLDVDHFKNFNDNYGHEAGDQALRMVASRLSQSAAAAALIAMAAKNLPSCFPARRRKKSLSILIA